MRAHVQKPSQPKQEASLHPSRLTQHTIRNEVALGEPHVKAEGLKGWASTSATTHFSHDFSRMPVHSKSQVSLQAKLTVNTPGDIYEQEADRISKQVMRMPEPQLQYACACGGGCPKCQTNQPLQTHERLQTKRVQASNLGQIAAPSIVREVLRSPGHPLDLSTRVFMEQRFGHNFGQVRVHADAKAAESARAIDALAYSVAPNIVFGAGQYEPHTTVGLTLLAHELTHVIQREAGDVIRRHPMAQEIKADAWLKELAEQPHNAHREWKRLTNMEMMGLVAHMTNRYGYDFAKSFLWYTKHPIESGAQHFGPGFPEHTPEWFQARGYQMWQRSSVNEFWVHPSGKMIMKILDQKRDSRTQPATMTNEDSAALADATLLILRDTISAETAEKEYLVGLKDRLESMNKITHAYREQYGEYSQLLQGMKVRLEAAVDDIETMRRQLVEMNSAAVSTVDDQLQELSNLQNWADVESSLSSTQFLQPIKLPSKDYPDDEE